MYHKLVFLKVSFLANSVVDELSVVVGGAGGRGCLHCWKAVLLCRSSNRCHPWMPTIRDALLV